MKMIKISYELERQQVKNLWDEARNSENSKLSSRDGKAFETYLNMITQQAFKAGREFQNNLKDNDVNYD